MVLALDDILDGEWLRSTSYKLKESIKELVSFVIISFEAGLQERRYPWFL